MGRRGPHVGVGRTRLSRGEGPGAGRARRCDPRPLVRRGRPRPGAGAVGLLARLRGGPQPGLECRSLPAGRAVGRDGRVAAAVVGPVGERGAGGARSPCALEAGPRGGSRGHPRDDPDDGARRRPVLATGHPRDPGPRPHADPRPPGDADSPAHALSRPAPLRGAVRVRRRCRRPPRTPRRPRPCPPRGGRGGGRHRGGARARGQLGLRRARLGRLLGLGPGGERSPDAVARPPALAARGACAVGIIVGIAAGAGRACRGAARPGVLRRVDDPGGGERVGPRLRRGHRCGSGLRGARSGHRGCGRGDCGTRPQPHRAGRGHSDCGAGRAVGTAALRRRARHRLPHRPGSRHRRHRHGRGQLLLSRRLAARRGRRRCARAAPGAEGSPGGRGRQCGRRCGRGEHRCVRGTRLVRNGAGRRRSRRARSRGAGRGGRPTPPCRAPGPRRVRPHAAGCRRHHRHRDRVDPVGRGGARRDPRRDRVARRHHRRRPRRRSHGRDGAPHDRRHVARAGPGRPHRDRHRARRDRHRQPLERRPPGGPARRDRRSRGDRGALPAAGRLHLVGRGAHGSRPGAQSESGSGPGSPRFPRSSWSTVDGGRSGVAASSRSGGSCRPWRS